MTERTRLYGLTVDSELPLHQERPAPPDSPTDLTIRLGSPTAATDEPPPGRVLLDLRASRQFYTGSRTDHGYVLRFYGTCDVHIDEHLRTATVRLVDGASPHLAAVLAGGTVLAFVLAMRGAAVLHASAVQVGGSALGFVGASGMGKSTMATIVCADGARLITDDLLRLELSQTPPTCSLGATESRLRKATGDLAARFPDVPGRRSTGDDRDALAVPVAQTEGLPLAALVVPLPDHQSSKTTATLERVPPMAAFLLLSRFPRLVGWSDEEILKQHFGQLADVVERVPVYTAELPWGPPFPAELGNSVLRGVGLVP